MIIGTMKIIDKFYAKSNGVMHAFGRMNINGSALVRFDKSEPGITDTG